MKPRIYRKMGYLWFVEFRQDQPDGKHLDVFYCDHSPQEAWRRFLKYMHTHQPCYQEACK